MTLRHCDICGAADPADEIDGVGILMVVRHQPRAMDLVEILRVQQAPPEQYDFCAECSQHLVRLIAERRIARA